MHSKFVSISAIAAISLLPLISSTTASAIDSPDCQEILIECPVWEWEPSPVAGIEYELCFDDIDHCVVAEIGSSVCIPSLGAHDVWVTAIEYQDGEPIECREISFECRFNICKRNFPPANHCRVKTAHSSRRFLGKSPEFWIQKTPVRRSRGSLSAISRRSWSVSSRPIRNWPLFSAESRTH
jgi:hypothetical protein